MPPPESIWGSVGRLAQSFLNGTPDAHQTTWNALSPWVQALVQEAGRHWIPYLTLKVPCEVIQRDPTTGIGSRCPSAAIAGCLVCKKPVCLNHALVSPGIAMCFPCALAHERAAREAEGAPPRPHAPPPPPPHQHTPPPPPPAIDVQIAAARKVLKVKRSATWAEVEASYKKLLVKYHPDRNPTDRAGAEARFKEARAAYDLLKKAYPQ